PACGAAADTGPGGAAGTGSPAPISRNSRNSPTAPASMATYAPAASTLRRADGAMGVAVVMGVASVFSARRAGSASPGRRPGVPAPRTIDPERVVHRVNGPFRAGALRRPRPGPSARADGTGPSGRRLSPLRV